jgi:6-phosphogluconolactonase
MHSDHRLLSQLSRRAFLRSTAAVAALAPLRRVARATSPLKQDGFAYVACRSRTGSEDDSLQVSFLRGGRWTAIQRLPTRAPACVVLSPDEQTLYVANEIGTHEGLPRGTVEAFRVDPSDGQLSLLSRQALSLAATYPRRMALSPDGRLLAVATDGGAIYNLLPVAADGGLDSPSSIFKELDRGPHTRLLTGSDPHRLLFDSTGKYLLSSGFGRRRMSAFTVAPKTMSRRMQQHTVEVDDDSGACALHPDGSVFYVRQSAANNLSCYRYDSSSGTVGEIIQRVAMPMRGSDVAPAGLAIHPSGRMLYTAGRARGSLQAWKIHAQGGFLSQAKHVEFEGAPAYEMFVAPNGQSLFVLDDSRGLIRRIAVDPVTGEPGFVEDAAMIRGAQSIVFKTL